MGTNLSSVRRSNTFIGVATAVALAFQPSPYQKRIFEFIQDPLGGSAIIEAVAGSGKSTTILQSLKLLPVTAKVLVVAFNKAIVEELRPKVPKHVFVKTFHSTCLYVYNRWLGREVEMDDRKVSKLVKQVMTRSSTQGGHWEMYRGFVNKLIGYAKGAGMGVCVPDVAASWQTLIDHHDLTLDSTQATVDQAIQYAQQVLRLNNAMTGVIDYDDMLYLTLVNNINFYRNDWVMVDEAQDLNVVQRVLLKRLLKPNGRLIAVGDSAQAIYGFRGANADGMALMAKEFNCVKLPLTVSYRCPRAVVAEARKYVSHIEPSPTAKEGQVLHLAEYTPETFTSRDAILCRNSAPLVSMAYSLLQRGIGCRILGREMGQGLVDLIEKCDADETIPGLVAALEAYRQREVAALIEKEKEEAAAGVNDKVDCLLLFINQLTEGNRTVAALINKIDSIFSDKADGTVLTLATVHKSKGMEWDNVFILDFEKYMPSKYARQPWQQDQERHLQYVAVTRTKDTLAFIDSDTWKKVQAEQQKVTPPQPAPVPAKVVEALTGKIDLKVVARLATQSASLLRVSQEAQGQWRKEAFQQALDEIAETIARLRAMAP